MKIHTHRLSQSLMNQDLKQLTDVWSDLQIYSGVSSTSSTVVVEVWQTESDHLLIMF